MRPAAVTLRVYRALASAFPQEFQNVYGDEMLQAAEDAIEPVWRRHGTAGLARLLPDIALRLPAEYLTELRQDVRQGLRMLAGSPGFTAVAVISLSLGICIASCAYSEVNGLLRDLPGAPNADQLVALQAPVSYPAYKRFREMKEFFSGAFAYVALASVGLAGMTAYSVARRGHEIGIRMALGARKGNVLALIMKEGAALVAVGTLAGTALALAGMRALASMFFTVASVQGYDPVLLVGAPLLLGGIAMAACYMPARRAMRIDPAVTLRME